MDYDGDFVKLEMGEEDVRTVIDEHYGLSGGNVKKLMGFDDLNYHCCPKENRNPHISVLSPHGYTLKITNHLESKNDDFSEGQNSLMLFLRENKILSPVPVKSVSGKFYGKLKIPLEHGDDERREQREHTIKLLEYLPGTLLKDVPLSHPILFKLGKFTGSLAHVLKRFSHPVYRNHSSIWHLQNVGQVKKYLDIVENLELRKLSETVINEFIRTVLPQEEKLERGVIHGDLNEHNILMKQSQEGLWDVCGLLDFGDSHFSCYLYDLALAQCYMMLECRRQNLDPIVGAGHLLAGYIVTHPSAVEHYNLLKICICARLCQSLVLGLKAYSLNPENRYVLSSQPNGWAVLQQLWQTTDHDVARIWNSVIHLYGLNADSSKNLAGEI